MTQISPETETDIVQRLRAPVYVNKHYEPGKEYTDPVRVEAADEIEHLREELESAKAQVHIALHSNGFQLLGLAQRPSVTDEMAVRAALAHNEDPRPADSCITVGEAKRIVEAALSLSSTERDAQTTREQAIKDCAAVAAKFAANAADAATRTSGASVWVEQRSASTAKQIEEAITALANTSTERSNG